MDVLILTNLQRKTLNANHRHYSTMFYMILVPQTVIDSKGEQK